jgi:hypothetical protein
MIEGNAGKVRSKKSEQASTAMGCTTLGIAVRGVAKAKEGLR